MRLFLLVAALAFAQKPPPPPVEEKLPGTPPEQPLAFSHKTHVTAAKLKCQDCHTMSGEGFQAGIPKESFCMGCHVAIKKESPQIQKLASFAKEKKAVPWARIYRVPDIIWFSHSVHAKDKGFACDTCHGPVGERDVLFKEKPTNMTSCMACHAAHKASNGCDFCHASQ
ncbi:MAG: cytochrome c3 family protein [Acidobacteria bacterium]|nr:cytochrome c3 family protein [Acidobacteriota bacterium]